MYLSNFQKKIVVKIANEEIKTVKDFLIQFSLIRVGSPDFSFDDVEYEIVDRKDLFNKLIDFKKVLNLLSKADLIEIDKSATLNFGYLVTADRAADIIDVIDSNRKDLIIPYNEIIRFAKDFKTPQERLQSKQTWVPIIVAIATVLLSSIINYLIYTKEREVFIKNSNAFHDSIYVKVLNDIDSSKNKNRTELDSINTQKANILSGKKLEED